MSTMLTPTGVELRSVFCSECGITFAVPEHWDRARRKDHRTFYCPNGHGRYYASLSEEEKLRRALRRAEARETHERDQREAAERSLSAQKGQTTRLRNRIAAGVCPECHRSFQNVRRHMQGQHPGFAETDS